MEISGQRYAEIQIVTEEDELIASISDEDAILKDGYKIICVPVAHQEKQTTEIRTSNNHILL